MTIDSNYYLARKQHLLERLEQDAQDWRRVMTDTFDGDFAAAVIQQARAEFDALLPHIPYIGGDENPLTGSLVRSARCLALFRALTAHGKTAAEAGKVLYDAAVIQAARPAPPIPPGERLSEDALMQRRRARTEQSQHSRYPDDFVYEFVDGDGEPFDYGYNFAACASLTFYRAQGAEAFMPFFCFLDFPLGQAVNLGLSRTMTLTEGHPVCNHRFTIGGTPAQA